MTETRERETMRFEVGPASEIPHGSRKIVHPFGGSGIGVFNVHGHYYAVKNTCPHMGAPICRGKVTGTTVPTRTPDGRVALEWVREGEILRCPWHHWEFELATGHTVFPSRQRVATYKVTVGPAGEHGIGANGGGTEAGGTPLAPSVETYPVIVEDAMVYLVLNAR